MKQTDGDQSGSAKQDDDARVEQGTSAIEWVAAALGAVLLAAMIGYMAVTGLMQDNGTPIVEVSAEPPIRQGQVFLVRFTATNNGDATATSVVVRATLADNDGDIESHEATVDYLPPQSTRGGGFYFSQDPARHKLAVVATSYLDP